MIQINLSDWRNRKQQKHLALMSVVEISLLFIATTGYVLLSNAIESDNQRIQHHITQDQKIINNTILLLNMSKSQQNALNWLKRQHNEIERLTNEQDKLFQFLHSISEDIPHDLWLTKLAHNEKSLVIEGNALTYKSISHFASLLKHHPFTQQLKIEHINTLSPESYLSFKLEEK